MTELYRTIQEYLAMPRPGYAVSERAFHDSAVDTVTETSIRSMLTNDMGAIALSSLRDFPFDDFKHLMQNAPLDSESLRQMRKMRKHLTLARDTLNISNAVDLIDVEETEPLRSFIMNIGVISDTNGTDQEVLDIVNIQVEDAKMATSNIENTYLQPVSYDVLRLRLQNALATDMLVDYDHQALLSEDYHIARQSFRSVIYTAIISDIIEPTARRKKFIAEGLRLNGIYGDRRHGTPLEDTKGAV